MTSSIGRSRFAHANARAMAASNPLATIVTVASASSAGCTAGAIRRIGTLLHRERGEHALREVWGIVVTRDETEQQIVARRQVSADPATLPTIECPEATGWSHRGWVAFEPTVRPGDEVRSSRAVFESNERRFMGHGVLVYDLVGALPVEC